MITEKTNAEIKTLYINKLYVGYVKTKHKICATEKQKKINTIIIKNKVSAINSIITI